MKQVGTIQMEKERRRDPLINQKIGKIHVALNGNISEVCKKIKQLCKKNINEKIENQEVCTCSSSQTINLPKPGFTADHFLVNGFEAKSLVKTTQPLFIQIEPLINNSFFFFFYGLCYIIFLGITNLFYILNLTSINFDVHSIIRINLKTINFKEKNNVMQNSNFGLDTGKTQSFYHGKVVATLNSIQILSQFSKGYTIYYYYY